MERVDMWGASQGEGLEIKNWEQPVMGNEDAR